MNTVKESSEIIGSAYEIVFAINGQEVIILTMITYYVENMLIVFEFISGEMIKNDLITFQQDNSNTTLKNNSAIIGRNYISQCMFAFFKGMFRSIDQEYLDKSKEFTTNA
jgi:hypothetical protein